MKHHHLFREESVPLTGTELVGQHKEMNQDYWNLEINDLICNLTSELLGLFLMVYFTDTLLVWSSKIIKLFTFKSSDRKKNIFELIFFATLCVLLSLIFSKC